MEGLLRHLKQYRRPFVYFLSAKVSLILLIVLFFFAKETAIANKYHNLDFENLNITSILETSQKQLDVWNYILIAQHGYPQDHKIIRLPGYFDEEEAPEQFFMDDRIYAFFPLLPLLLRGLGFLGINEFYAGLLISFLASLVTVLLLYDLLPKKYKDTAVIFYLLSPISIYNMSGYTEALFIMLGILAFYLYKKQKYLALGFTLAAVMLTRNMGLLITLVFISFILFDAVRNRRWVNFIKTILPAGLLGFLYNFYIFLVKGDFLYYGTVTIRYWNRSLGIPIISAFWRDYITISEIRNIEEIAPIILAVVFNIFAIVILINSLSYLYRQKNWLMFFLLLVTGMAIVSQYQCGNIFGSVGYIRYIYGLFPIYLVFPEILAELKSVSLRILLEFGWLAGWVVFSILFLMNTYMNVLVA